MEINIKSVMLSFAYINSLLETKKRETKKTPRPAKSQWQRKHVKNMGGCRCSCSDLFQFPHKSLVSYTKTDNNAALSVRKA